MTIPTFSASPEDEQSQRGRRALNTDPVVSIPPAVYPGRQPLVGPRAQLEPLDPRPHCDGLFDVGHADESTLALWEYLPYGPFADRTAMHNWMRQCAASSDPVFCALRDSQSKCLMGMASFLEIRPMIGVIEIGHIWLAPPFQQTPQATEALVLMMRHAFDDLANRRLEWKCNALNLPSRNAALRLGFRYEGVFYNHNIVKGNNRDTAWYSILDSEWPAVQANLERWLAAENFDSDGRQRSSLSSLNRALW